MVPCSEIDSINLSLFPPLTVGKREMSHDSTSKVDHDSKLTSELEELVNVLKELEIETN